MIMFYLRRNLKRCQYMQNFMSSASAVASSRCWILQNGLSVCLFWLDSPPVGQGLLIHEVLCRPLPLYFRRGAGYCKEVCLFVCFGSTAPQWARASSFTRFYVVLFPCTFVAVLDTAKQFVCLFVCLFVCFGSTASQWARASSFTRFLDHTQRRTTVSRTYLDE